jgi:hypothetical protein
LTRQPDLAQVLVQAQQAQVRVQDLVELAAALVQLVADAEVLAAVRVLVAVEAPVVLRVDLALQAAVTRAAAVNRPAQTLVRAAE